MTELHELSAIESVAKIKSGGLKAEQLVRSCLERIEERDSLVRAWSHLDNDKVNRLKSTSTILFLGYQSILMLPYCKTGTC